MGRVAPLRLRDSDEDDMPQEPGQAPGLPDRVLQRGTGPNTQKQKRPVYPSDISRRERGILAVLDSEEDKQYLKEEADRAGLSPSRLASLLLQKALADLRKSKVRLERRSATIEEYSISDNE